MLLAVISLLIGLARSERLCGLVGSSSLVIEQAVSVNTYITTNTTFNPIPEIALTITDAPTSLDTLTTFSWTSTLAATQSAEPVPSSFVLVSQQHSNSKRQSGTTYVAQNGTLTQDCASAVQYSVVNGQLIANASDGTVYYFSTSVGVAYEPFVPTTIPGNISTVFSITTAYGLSWANSHFYNGNAQFCSVNGTIYAVFELDKQPEGCFFAPLSPAYGPGCALWGNSGWQNTDGDKS